MKANAPEKIYLNPLLMEDGESVVRRLTFERQRDSQIEYTRTDAFIKKAVGYLNSKLYDWVQTTNPNQRSCANTIMKQDFIEDFRKYMKGE